jgi:adenosine deaminase
MTRDELNALPKVELHLHLDCSMSFESVHALVPEMTPERYRAEFLAPKKCKSLVDYFRYLGPPLALLQTREALRIQTSDMLRQLAADNIIYAELRFAPHLHRQTGLTTDEVVEIVLAAVEESRARYPVEVRLILCTLRPDDTASGLDLVRIADKYRDQGVGGFDLAGDEAGYPLDQHIPVFRAARDKGLNITAHAGEAVGAHSVREVIEQLGTRRIGHGVRSIEDPAVIELLLANDVHLEVCPSCNIQIDVFDRYEDHPVDALVRRGVSVGINTDARGPTDLTLTEEYEQLQAVFGWDEARFRAANLGAIERAFADEATKAAIRAKLAG